MTVQVDREVLKKSKSLGIDVNKSCTNHLKTLNAEIEAVLNGTPEEIQAGAKNILNPGEFNQSTFYKWLLQEHTPEVSRYMVKYAVQYAKCLTEGNLDSLLNLKPGKKRLIMASLSALAKFKGVHDAWKELLKKYNLKWSGKSADELVIDRITNIHKPGEVFEWVHSVKKKFPDLRNFMDLIAVSGLRFVETVNSFNLLIRLAKTEGIQLLLDDSGKKRLSGYYNYEKKALEHFWFGELFLRNNKKAFLSFVPRATIERICMSRTYIQLIKIRNTVRTCFPLRFSDVREANGTFLTKYLKREEIDFLHGRVTSSVFMKNYFNPALITDLQERAFKGINEILELIG